MHSSETPIDSVDPEWRTYCGLTYRALMRRIAGPHAGFVSWKPHGQMTCAACRAAALPPDGASLIELEEWLGA